MDKSGASAYVYAKASGMLARSFIGPRVARLFEAKTLAELWTLVYKTEVPVVPEMILAQKLEREAELRFIDDFGMLLDTFNKPDAVSLTLFRHYDYNNLKDIGSALRTGGPIPELEDIGKYRLLNYEQWPDIGKMTRGSSLAWYNKVPTLEEEVAWENKLDLQYMSTLWREVLRLPSKDRHAVEPLIKETITFENIIWAIRLRVYYNMTAEDIIPRLASASGTPDKNDPLCGSAVRILDWATDSYAEWEKWKYASLLNPHEEGVVWSLDPRWVQQAINVRQNKRFLSKFHQNPFTASVLVTWFYIKQYELNCIRTAAEGIRLNVPDNQLKNFVGVQ